jgi:hypothetical protein
MITGNLRRHVSDPYFSSVAVLLHMDGATITDSSRNALTVTNTAATLSSSPAKFGTAAQFNGSTAFLACPAGAFSLGSANFTIEGWLYSTSRATKSHGVFQWYDNGTTGNIFGVWQNTSGGLDLSYTGVTFVAGPANTLPLTTWTHFAVVRNGTNISLYTGGVATTSYTLSGAVPTQTTGLKIGGNVGGDTNNLPWFGAIDEFRVTLGVARYTAAFIPPNTPFPNN